MGNIVFIFLLSITHVTLILNLVIAANPKKGFSIKMIHRDSKESPFYPGDHFTREERLQSLVEQSKSQARYIESQILQARYIESQILLNDNATRSIKPDVVRLPVVYEPSKFYVAMVGLGTFPRSRKIFKNYYLIIDSGSDITWLQCEGATEAFYQNSPLYPWTLSTTYRHVPCYTHPLCREDNCNDDGQCTYKASYASGSVASGIMAKEIFTLSSSTGALETIDLRMGCGFRQQNFELLFGKNYLHGKSDLVAGILGLGLGEWSFLNQLGAAGEGKFSYCFETFNDNIQGSDTYLRFGSDATIGGASQTVSTTPIVVPEFHTYQYYLNLEDISVGNKKIGFRRGTFKLNSRGEGGTVIDSGAPISVMYRDHFNRVAAFVKAHFSELGIEYIGTQEGFDVCFRLRGRFDVTNYPSITLHFERANYIITDYKANFVMISAEIFCLGLFQMDENRPAFILGAMQQANKRILYNVMDQSLSFATELCELGS